MFLALLTCHMFLIERKKCFVFRISSNKNLKFLLYVINFATLNMVGLTKKLLISYPN